VAKLAAVHGERAKLYQKRQEILELGPPAEHLLTEWVHHPRMNWKSQVEQLHDLLMAHGPQRTLGALGFGPFVPGAYRRRSVVARRSFTLRWRTAEPRQPGIAIPATSWLGRP